LALAQTHLAPPHQFLTLTEPMRSMQDFMVLQGSHGLLNAAPKGDGHAVVVLPGFMAGDRSTKILRDFLVRKGYAAYGWGMGQNTGEATVHFEEKLQEMVAEIVERHGARISIVGQSLGGVFAREIARGAPEIVRQVITLGSPFAGHGGSANFSSKIYSAINHHTADEAELERGNLHIAPPVPNTSIFSKMDGIVAWRKSIQRGGECSENIEVFGAHCGMGFNAAILYAVADRLAQNINEWTPFEPKGLVKFAYPCGGKAHEKAKEMSH
jgi:pimeloyl-ACP methyl ester carboxylesterase